MDGKPPAMRWAGACSENGEFHSSLCDAFLDCELSLVQSVVDDDGRLFFVGCRIAPTVRSRAMLSKIVDRNDMDAPFHAYCSPQNWHGSSVIVLLLEGFQSRRCVRLTQFDKLLLRVIVAHLVGADYEVIPTLNKAA